MNLTESHITRYAHFANEQMAQRKASGDPDPAELFRTVEWERHAGPLDEIDEEFYFETNGA